MWLLVVSLLSLLGGWRTLARYYSADVPKEAVDRPLPSVTLGRWGFPRVHYRGALQAAFEGDKLLLRPHPLFRWAHKPIAIPKSDIRATECQGYLRRYVSLSAAAHPGITLHLPVHHFRWPEILEARDR